MFVKILVVCVLLTIIWCLGSAFYYLFKDKSRSVRTVKALTFRIILSISLFLMLFLGFATGIIKPHGLG